MEGSIDKDGEKLEHLCAVGGTIKWSTAMENSIKVPQKLNTELPYDQDLSIYMCIRSMHLCLLDTQHHFYSIPLFKAITRSAQILKKK